MRSRKTFSQKLAAILSVASLGALALTTPAAASVKTFVAADQATVLSHSNPSVTGVGATLVASSAVWNSQTWDNPVTYAWLFRATCNGSPSFSQFALTSGGSANNIGGATLTVPNTIWTRSDPCSPLGGFLTSLATDGLVIGVVSAGENSTHRGSSLSNLFTVGQALAGGQPSQALAPIKYSGPEFSGLSAMPVLSGSSATLEGRKLDQISSITIDGKVAKLSDATDKSLKLELPDGLAPGVYDLVVTTTNHGKLTHMNAIRIREELVPSSLTIQGTGVLSGNEFKELTAFARTQNPDMNTVTCIVNSSSVGKSFMQARALCDRIAATNLNITTTMFEVRSTFKSSAIFARVVFSHEE